jgi:hypothetical protein
MRRARSMRRVSTPVVRMTDGTHRVVDMHWLPSPTSANPWCQIRGYATTCPLEVRHA